MLFLDLNLDEFFTWLASHHDQDVVGWPGRCFHSPLARFLSFKAGCTMGEDGSRYGSALVDDCRWLQLPHWAHTFAVFCEAWFGRELTAYEAVGLLAQVETALSPVPVLTW